MHIRGLKVQLPFSSMPPSHPQGRLSEYVNPYIPTQSPDEEYSDHMQSPG